MFSIQYSPPQAINLTEGFIQGAQVGANIAGTRASERANIRNYMANMAQLQEQARQFNISQRESSRQFNINKQLAQKENDLTRRKMDFANNLSLANLDINRGNLEVERFKATETAKRYKTEETATNTPETPRVTARPFGGYEVEPQEAQAQQRVDFVNPYQEQQRKKFEEQQVKALRQQVQQQQQQQQQQPSFQQQPFTLASSGGRGFGGYQDFLP